MGSLVIAGAEQGRASERTTDLLMRAARASLGLPMQRLELPGEAGEPERAP